MKVLVESEDLHDRLTRKFERALASRLAGTYGKAYKEGFANGRGIGIAEGRQVERVALQEAGVRLPPIKE